LTPSRGSGQRVARSRWCAGRLRTRGCRSPYRHPVFSSARLWTNGPSAKRHQHCLWIWQGRLWRYWIVGLRICWKW